MMKLDDFGYEVFKMSGKLGLEYGCSPDDIEKAYYDMLIANMKQDMIDMIKDNNLEGTEE